MSGVKAESGNTMCNTRLSVVKRVQRMRYESGQPEPGLTAGGIYAAWAVAIALILSFVLFSII